ncbi:hypothetical protein BaRGS_00031025, partial [Batillaria attramentaria]
MDDCLGVRIVSESRTCSHSKPMKYHSGVPTLRQRKAEVDDGVGSGLKALWTVTVTLWSRGNAGHLISDRTPLLTMLTNIANDLDLLLNDLCGLPERTVHSLAYTKRATSNEIGPSD